jgi:hypothetical protein
MRIIRNYLIPTGHLGKDPRLSEQRRNAMFIWLGLDPATLAGVIRLAGRRRAGAAKAPASRAPTPASGEGEVGPGGLDDMRVGKTDPSGQNGPSSSGGA